MNKQAKTSSMILGIGLCVVYHTFRRRICLRRTDLYLLCQIWHLVLIMPVLAMLYNAVFFAYCLRFARKHEVYDYRSYNNAFLRQVCPDFFQFI